jgi:hypothetical protein
MSIKILHDNAPKSIQAGLDLLLALINGIKNNINQLVTATVNLITTFLGAVSSNLGRIIIAGGQVLTSFLRGIANNIALVVTTVGDIYVKFLGAIASNLGRVATAGLSILTKLLGAIASGVSNMVKTGTDLIVGFITGVANAGSRVITAGTNAIIKLINGLSSNAVKLANAGADAIVAFLNGVAAAIETHSGDIRAAGFRIGVAIADGMTGGMASKAKAVADKGWSLGKGALGAIADAVGAKSPSKEAHKIGQYVVMGFANGLSDSAPAVASATKLGKDVLANFNAVFRIGTKTGVMYDIGTFVSQGFAQGLRGSTDEITSAFSDLNSKLTDAMRTARETIATEQDKLNELRKAKKPDADAIKQAQDILNQNEDILKRSTAAHSVLVTTLRSEGVEMLKLSTAYDKISEKLSAAKDALALATQTRDDAVKSFSDQFAALPDIVTTDAEGNSIDQLATYMGALDNQAKAVSAYQSTLDALRKLGLDDATYQKLLSEGPEDQRFADQLLAGGQTAVSALNVLDTNLMTVSKTLAVNAATNLYQAGVDAASGLVKGLASQSKAIEKQMIKLANEMIADLKKALKIKSPSEAFAEIGQLSMEGMAKGFSDSSQIVTDAVDQAAKDALTAMQRSMQGISDTVMGELDANPTITPVLDLTQVRSQSAELAALTAVTPITAATSFGQASTISSEQTAAQAEQVAVAPGGTSVKFEQNNYSPESLSEIEIYRQTKNQLSQIKSVLAFT